MNGDEMSQTLLEHPYAKQIWDLLMIEFNNPIGVSALMGNLQAESGLYPDRVQGDVPYSNYSKQYTAQVDSGEISETDFVINGPNGGGYGLAQWTYYTRKQGLYDLYKNGGYGSIGDVTLAVTYLVYELFTSFTAVYALIKESTDIRTVSNAVLHDFESPADQSVSVEELRASMGQEIYNTFAGGSTPTIPPTQQSKRRRLSKLLLFAIATEDI